MITKIIIPSKRQPSRPVLPSVECSPENMGTKKQIEISVDDRRVWLGVCNKFVTFLFSGAFLFLSYRFFSYPTACCRKRHRFHFTGWSLPTGNKFANILHSRVAQSFSIRRLLAIGMWIVLFVPDFGWALPKRFQDGAWLVVVCQSVHTRTFLYKGDSKAGGRHNISLYHSASAECNYVLIPCLLCVAFTIS